MLTLSFIRTVSSLSWPALLCFACVSLACHSSTTSGENTGAAEGVVVINSPVTGQVRRILVTEGSTVEKNTPVVEIAVQESTGNAAPSNKEDPRAQARSAAQAAQSEVASARSEVERTRVEVERVTPLVASGTATQPELDAARAQYQRAQERLQKAQSAVGTAQDRLVIAQGNTAPGPATIAPREKLVEASAPEAGVVRVISARIGQTVSTGQALATVRTNAR